MKKLVDGATVLGWGLVALLSGNCFASTSSAQCDRSCLKGIADQVVASMLAHDASSLPLARPYTATENGKPSILPMMSLWRTPTSISSKRQTAFDADSGQIFIAGVIQEGGLPSILSARIKVVDRQITEYEAYVSRSKSDTGWHFNPAGVDDLPALWTKAIPSSQRASRAELDRVGRAAWDAAVTVPVAKDCHAIENGDNLGAENLTCPKTADPTDANARVSLIDVDQGIVVAIGHISGSVAQGGAFIPESMMINIRKLPEPPHGAEFDPIATVQPAADTVVLVSKYYSGQVQGVQSFMYIQGPNAAPIWTQNAAAVPQRNAK